MVCEAGDDIGERVRTDRSDGFLLDRGFQVVLPAYPELRRQTDVSALRLQPFTRGVLAMTAGGRVWRAGPWHGREAAAGMAGFLLGHPGDSAALAALSLRDMLEPDHVVRDADPAATTIEELRRRFSPATVTEVLRPFLAGVLLDPSLESPAPAVPPALAVLPPRRGSAARRRHADGAPPPRRGPADWRRAARGGGH